MREGNEKDPVMPLGRREAGATPFACRESDVVVFEREGRKENKKKGIFELISGKRLSAPEIFVIDQLRWYGFLNARMIGSILAGEIGYPADAVKDLLSRMYHAGLVIRFRIAYFDAVGTEHRSPYVYMLADELLKNEVGDFSSRTVYSYLAFNQFCIRMKGEYRKEAEVYYLKRQGSSMDGSVVISGGGRRVELGVVAVRRGKDSGTETMRVLSEAAKARGKVSAILILCESEFHALDIERLRMATEGARDLQAFYLTDAATVGQEPPLSVLLRVLPGFASYETCSIIMNDISDVG